MRLELRASAGAVCKECGSTALLHTAATNEAFVTDLTDLLAERGQELAASSDAVMEAKIDKARGQLKAHVDERLDMIRAELAAVYQDELDALTGALDGYLSRDIHRLRLVKRRYRDEMRAVLLAEVDALKARTHLA